MYNVTITNNYILPLFVGTHKVADPHGGKGILAHFSNQALTVPGMGDINFIDIGNRKIDKFTIPDVPWTKSTWGGVVRYRGLDAYFRYEGEGMIEVTVDELGSVSLHFPQGGMIVKLADLRVV